MANDKKLVDYLEGYDIVKVENYIEYVKTLYTGEKTKYWASTIPTEKYAEYFKKVDSEGLTIDGKHITIQSTGLSYDYVAYKNKMLIVYPKTKIDIALVYEGDEFSFSKSDGVVIYTHNIKNPFNKKDADIIGGYCVIKNERGEFLTTLSKDEFEKHKRVAKTKTIWDAWYSEMCLKTLIKKACKQHFADIYDKIEDQDNTQNDLSLAMVEANHQEAIANIDNLSDLNAYYQKHSGIGKEFASLIAKRKKELSETS